MSFCLDTKGPKGQDGIKLAVPARTVIPSGASLQKKDGKAFFIVCGVCMRRAGWW